MLQRPSTCSLCPTLYDFAPTFVCVASRYSAVDAGMLALRAVVMARKEPRKLMVQPHLQPGTDGVELNAEYVRGTVSTTRKEQHAQLAQF